MRVTFHKANNNEWVWTVQSIGNWKTVGYSSETFKNKSDCIVNFNMLTGRSVSEDENKAVVQTRRGSDEETSTDWVVRFDD